MPANGTLVVWKIFLWQCLWWYCCLRQFYERVGK